MTIAPVESPPRAGEPAPRFGFEASAMARRVCRVWRHAHVPKTHSGEQRQPCNNDFGAEMDERVPKPNFRGSSTFLLVVVR